MGCMESIWNQYVTAIRAASGKAKGCAVAQPLSLILYIYFTKLSGINLQRFTLGYHVSFVGVA
jgi:hypothetical protein